MKQRCVSRVALSMPTERRTYTEETHDQHKSNIMNDIIRGRNLKKLELRSDPDNYGQELIRARVGELHRRNR